MSRFSQATSEVHNFRRISRKPLAKALKPVVILAIPLQVCRSSLERVQAFCKSASTYQDACKPLVFLPNPFRQIRKFLARPPVLSETFAIRLHVRPHSLARHPTLISKNPVAKLLKNRIRRIIRMRFYEYLIGNYIAGRYSPILFISISLNNLMRERPIA